jgi:hypothetical protein
VANLSLVFDILARDNASGAFRDVGNAAEKAGNQGQNFGNRLASGVKLAAAGLLGAGLIEGFKSLYDAAAESAKIGALTTQVIKTTGGAAGLTAKQVGDLATAISNKTGVDDEAIQSGENLLLTFTNIRNEAGKGNDVFTQATSIVTDMSVALGEDMSAASIQVGKALNDPIKGVTALQRVGVSFTESQKDQIATLVESGRTMDAQKIILSELSKEFGGAAEAAATPFDKLQVQLGNLAEQIGSYLIPVVGDISTFFTDDLLPAASKVGDVAGSVLVPALHIAGEALKDIVSAGGSIASFFGSLPGPIQAGAAALGIFLTLRGPLTDFFETIATRVGAMVASISATGSVMGALKSAGGGLLSIFGGPLGLAITGVTVGLGFLVQWLNKSDDATSQTAQSQTELAQALKASKGAIDDNVRAAAAKEAQDQGLLDAAQASGVSLSQVTDAILGQGNAYSDVISKLVAYRDANTGMNGERTKEGQLVAAAIPQLEALAGSTDKNIASAQQLAQATQETGTAAGGTTATMATLQSQLEDTASAASDGRKEIDLLKTSLDVLTGDSVSLLEAQSALNDAVDQGTDAIKGEGGAVLDASGALNTHTENGRAAADVLLDIRNRGNDLIATMIQQGATTADVTKADSDLRHRSFRPKTAWASPAPRPRPWPTRSSASPPPALPRSPPTPARLRRRSTSSSRASTGRA